MTSTDREDAVAAFAEALHEENEGGIASSCDLWDWMLDRSNRRPRSDTEDLMLAAIEDCDLTSDGWSLLEEEVRYHWENCGTSTPALWDVFAQGVPQ